MVTDWLNGGTEAAKPFIGFGEGLFYFIVYAFLGWALEGGHHRLRHGTFRKDGLLKGPVKPMYGLAPLLLLAVQRLGAPAYALAAAALVLPSAVEYAGGALLLRLFGRRWWDYREEPYQLGGHICLRYSLYWWLLSAASLVALQPVMERLYRLYAGTGTVAEIGLLLTALYVAADLAWSFRLRRKEAGFEAEDAGPETAE